MSLKPPKVAIGTLCANRNGIPTITRAGGYLNIVCLCLPIPAGHALISAERLVSATFGALVILPSLTAGIAASGQSPVIGDVEGIELVRDAVAIALERGEFLSLARGKGTVA